jgi:hypothetical protein
MADNNIPIKILNTIQEVGTETVEEGIKTTEQAISTVITGQELVGDAKPMNEEEMAKAKAEDERKSQEEIKNISGRNVEEEIKEVVKEKESEEEKEQREFLENIEKQRQEEEMERNNLITEPGNVKREEAKTQFSPGKRKKQEPNMTQMSQTSEFKGGKID